MAVKILKTLFKCLENFKSPVEMFCKCCNCLVCWAWNGLRFHRELKIFRVWSFGCAFSSILTYFDFSNIDGVQLGGKQKKWRNDKALTEQDPHNGILTMVRQASKSNGHFLSVLCQAKHKSKQKEDQSGQIEGRDDVKERRHIYCMWKRCFSFKTADIEDNLQKAIKNDR